MTFGRVMTGLVAGAAISLAGIAPAGAAAEPPPPGCWVSEPLELDYNGLWTYTFSVSWCVEGTEIVRVEPTVSHEEKSSACTWVGNIEESRRREPDSGLTLFYMSEFSCRIGDGDETRGVNPWVIVTIYPDGRHTVVGKDIEEQPVLA